LEIIKESREKYFEELNKPQSKEILNNTEISEEKLII
jgi:hypothetical protein